MLDVLFEYPIRSDQSRFSINPDRWSQLALHVVTVLRFLPPSGVVRAFEGGPNGLELIAVGSDRPEGGDGEMVNDFWTS